MGRRAMLIRLDDYTVNSIFEFHYNPSEYEDEESPQYEASKSPGNVRPTYQYKNGGDRTITFELLLNDFGQREKTVMTTYKAIQWLKESLRPKGISSESSDIKPREHLLVRGARSLKCFIVSIKVKEEIFATNSMLPVRARVQITLKESIDPVEAQESPVTEKGAALQEASPSELGHMDGKAFILGR